MRRTVTPIPNLESSGVEIPLSLTKEQKEALVVMVDVVRYWIERFDAEGVQRQAAGDLAIAYAQVRERMLP